jgi:hypothetical protein
MNNRRKLVIVLGAFAISIATPVLSQPTTRRRVGLIYSDQDAEILPHLKRGMRELGYVEGVRYRAGQYPVQPAKLMHLSFAGAINASLFGGVAL